MKIMLLKVLFEACFAKQFPLKDYLYNIYSYQFRKDLLSKGELQLHTAYHKLRSCSVNINRAESNVKLISISKFLRFYLIQFYMATNNYLSFKYFFLISLCINKIELTFHTHPQPLLWNIMDKKSLIKFKITTNVENNTNVIN